MEDTLTPREFVTLAEGIIASDYALKNLNKSLGEAQNEFTPAVKDEENKWGGYKYTPLANIIKAVRPSLIKHHLTVSQLPLADLERKTVSAVTRIVHWDSGEWIQGTLELPGELALGKDGAPKFNQQTIGGSQTYAQKYAYKAMVGIPDSEEMIDSTDEKGDLPSRPRAQRWEPSPPVPAAIPSVEPNPEERKQWEQGFAACLNVGEWNRNVVPLMKERSREFVVAAAEEAKRRGYTADRSTRLYTDPKEAEYAAR